MNAACLAIKPTTATASNRWPGTTAGITESWIKANVNDPLSSAQKKRNRRHQQVRSQVEHPFASIKDRYGLRWARAKTKLRNKARFVMASICWNIERGITWSKKQQNITPARAT
ncbi:transposase [Rhodohalobacter sp.]|uniref:transposase n=1 Tax=Rhodohalobacter sp. TaxID=1974210 RepID=UPI002ACEB5E1|nr:transposase [Rhodohalobacter sp.]MDZ7757219.1 transposase [Rhodohalobacter sp.]